MPVVLGTAGDDSLVGVDTHGDDDIQGLGGNDTIFAGVGGDDRLSGGDGADDLTVQGSGGFGRASLDGGAGDDRLEVNGISPTGAQITTSVAGGAGDDFIFIYGGNVSGVVDAGSGNDTLHFGPDHGALSVTLGSGVDEVRPDVNPFGIPTAALTLTDFQTGDGGDVLRLPAASSNFLVHWDQSNPFAGGYLRLVHSGADTILQIDADAGGAADSFQDLVRFQNTLTTQFTAYNFAGYPPSGGATPGQVITGSSTPGHERLDGTSGDDTINGLGLNDVIHAGAGNDLIDGGAGDDQIFSEAGDDTASGGAGNDSITGGQHDVLSGGAGNDRIGVLSLLGENVGVTLDGGDGDDSLTAVDLSERQFATLLGGAGNDVIYVGGDASLTVDGGLGDDLFILSNSTSAHLITTGGGADVIRFGTSPGFSTAATVTDFNAAAGGDRLQITAYLQANPSWDPDANPFTAGLIKLVAQGGSTMIQLPQGAGALRDALLLQSVPISALNGTHFEGYSPDGGPPVGMLLQGGPGADSILGGVGGDSVGGGDGADTLSGVRGDDVIHGDAGDDHLIGGPGADTINGGAGNDVIADSADTEPASSAPNYLRGDEGDDQIYGGGGFDDANGNMGNDTIHGNDGDDYSVGGKDSDLLFGDDGTDIVWGNLGADTCDGGNGDDQCRGGQGDDSVSGGAGADFVSGDRGADTVSGGAGADLFHTFSGAGLDKVLDFHLSEGDRVMLDPGTVFSVTQVGSDTVVDMGNGDQMILVGVQMSTLTPGWIFGA
jgi:Ca2+-binding RTX toxin-like protein